MPDNAAMVSDNGYPSVQKRKACGVSHEHDEPWIDDRKLLKEMDAAVEDIFSQRRSPEREIFDRARDEYVFLVNAYLTDHRPQKNSGPSDKRPTFRCLCSARRFADKDYCRIGVSFSGHRPSLTPSPAQWTLPNFCGYSFKLSFLVHLQTRIERQRGNDCPSPNGPDDRSPGRINPWPASELLSDFCLCSWPGTGHCPPY